MFQKKNIISILQIYARSLVHKNNCDHYPFQGMFSLGFEMNEYIIIKLSNFNYRLLFRSVSLPSSFSTSEVQH